MTPYPPQPWRLHASGWISFWRVPTRLVDSIPGLSILGLARSRMSVFGSAVLCSGFVEYGPPGDLTYGECFLAVLTKVDRYWGVTLPLIWVDSEPALRGGVELWAIPKQIATFDFRAPHYIAEVAERRIVELLVRRIGRLSVPVRASGSILQQRDSALVRTQLRASAKMRLVRAQWVIPENSPFAWLRHRQPWFSCSLTDATVYVGA